MYQGAVIFKGESDEAFTVICNGRAVPKEIAPMLRSALDYAEPFSKFSAAAFAAAFVAANLQKQPSPAEVPTSTPKVAKPRGGKKGKARLIESQPDTSETPTETPAVASETPLVILANNYRDYNEVIYTYKLTVEKGQVLITVSKVKCIDAANPKSVNAWERKKVWSSSLETFFTEIEEVQHPLAAGAPTKVTAAQ